MIKLTCFLGFLEIKYLEMLWGEDPFLTKNPHSFMYSTGFHEASVKQDMSCNRLSSTDWVKDAN